MQQIENVSKRYAIDWCVFCFYLHKMKPYICEYNYVNAHSRKYTHALTYTNINKNGYLSCAWLLIVRTCSFSLQLQLK